MADAKENRDWRIYADYAQCLIRRARPLYFDDPEFRLDMDNMVYALDSTTFVTRAKDNLRHTVVENFEVDKNAGVLEDKLISLDSV